MEKKVYKFKNVKKFINVLFSYSTVLIKKEVDKYKIEWNLSWQTFVKTITQLYNQLKMQKYVKIICLGLEFSQNPKKIFAAFR